jgi:hypothetical protein
MPIDSCLSSGAIQSLAVGGANNRATVVDAHNTRDPSAHGMSLDGAPGKIFMVNGQRGNKCGRGGKVILVEATAGQKAHAVHDVE